MTKKEAAEIAVKVLNEKRINLLAGIYLDRILPLKELRELRLYAQIIRILYPHITEADRKILSDLHTELQNVSLD